MHRGNHHRRPYPLAAPTRVARVGDEPTPSAVCPGAYWGHQARGSWGAEFCDRDEEKEYLVPQAEWGVPPPFGERRREKARYRATR